jgi:hypothetical protein
MTENCLSQIANPYDEDRWKDRYTVHVRVVDVEICAKDFDIDLPPPPKLSSKVSTQVSRVIRLQHGTNQILSAAPTVILSCVYGAAAFAIFSIGPAWVGFLVGFLVAFGIAAWAYSGSPKELSH